MTPFATSEKYLSQIPALQLLIGLGYEYLSPTQALNMRDGKKSNVLLEEVLRKQLKKINRIRYKGTEDSFSESNIHEAVRKLKNVKYDGLMKTNENIYDLITLGTALEQAVENDMKSFNLNYIDWKNPANNRFHVVPEYSVERSRSTETAVPDIVLFVNGIPLGVIECKSPTEDVEKAVSQNIRNQGGNYIPKLFTYAQLVMGINKNSAKYATVGTQSKLWSVWNELEDDEKQIAKTVKTPLRDDQKSELFSGQFATARKSFDDLEAQGPRAVTEQDRTIYGLCRPERLLDLTYRFTLFDSGIKKIARYQQFFVVRSIVARVKQRDDNGNRLGGIVWQTQGSGKSLTMVMLTRALALQTDITSPRILLVTDRDDLDKQLGNTFLACGLSRERAKSGRNLIKHLKDKVGIITTLVHKFDRGWVSKQFVDKSPDIFVLVDESHRTHYGELSSKMRLVLPNACYIGFTGTPLLKKEKNSFLKFGALIEPSYSFKRAVKDKSVLPLLYEGRFVEMKQNQEDIDLWFERHTAGLTDNQKADLKQKYAHANTLNKSNQVVYMRAFDISEHYRANWQNTGFKAQLVAPDKATAIKYHNDLKKIGVVTSEVVISPPDTREGHTEVDAGPTDAVREFWERMMKRFGSEDEYNKQIINNFKNGDEPEVLIVVNKLLTGFDAPRNTVMYLCQTLREHTLLQAIARVNRPYPGKDFGYIVDYDRTLGELDKALNMYDAFEGFDEQDLADTLASVNEEVEKLPQRHSHLWDLFREVANKHDEEEFEVLLADEEKRADFKERLTEYGRSLAVALSTDKFVMNTDRAKLSMYKNDLKRFQSLRKSVEHRYAETIDYDEYEQKIKKLLDTHIRASEVTQLNKPVNILDGQDLDAVKEEHGIYSSRSTAARADTIAYRTKKTITAKMDEDPAFYKRFSDLIQEAINDFRAEVSAIWNTWTGLPISRTKCYRGSVTMCPTGSETTPRHAPTTALSSRISPIQTVAKPPRLKPRWPSRRSLIGIGKLTFGWMRTPRTIPGTILMTSYWMM